MNSYPLPNDNPHCACQGNGMKQMLCLCGHMTECHYPYTCKEAGCSHLTRYDFTPQEAYALQLVAKEKMDRGELPPYPLPDPINYGGGPDE